MNDLGKMYFGDRLNYIPTCQFTTSNWCITVCIRQHLLLKANLNLLSVIGTSTEVVSGAV